MAYSTSVELQSIVGVIPRSLPTDHEILPPSLHRLRLNGHARSLVKVVRYILQRRVDANQHGLHPEDLARFALPLPALCDAEQGVDT